MAGIMLTKTLYIYILFFHFKLIIMVGIMLTKTLYIYILFFHIKLICFTLNYIYYWNRNLSICKMFCCYMIIHWNLAIKPNLPGNCFGIQNRQVLSFYRVKIPYFGTLFNVQFIQDSSLFSVWCTQVSCN